MKRDRVTFSDQLIQFDKRLLDPFDKFLQQLACPTEPHSNCSFLFRKQQIIGLDMLRSSVNFLNTHK